MENIQDKVEDKIIDLIALGSGGRLLATKPEGGADLVVQKKGDYQGSELFFAVKVFITPAESSAIKINVLEDELKQGKNHYVLFVLFDEVKQKIDEKVWVVPAKDFVKTAKKEGQNFEFNPSKFFKFQLTKDSFGDFLIDKLILQNKPKPKQGFKPKTY